MKSLNLGWRDRTEAVLRKNQPITATELLVAVILQLLQALRILSGAGIFLFLLGWLSLWLRKRGWSQLGLSRPASWGRTLAIAASVGLAYQVASLWVIVPGLHHLTHEPLDLSQFAPLRANVAWLIVWLTVSWTLAAFGEELAYRGYLLNRVADLLGHSRAGWVVGLLGTSALFGLGHAYQGITGMLETFLFACVMASLYLVGRRNLWLPVIAHGVYDTVAFVLIFLGLYP